MSAENPKKTDFLVEMERKDARISAEKGLISSEIRVADVLPLPPFAQTRSPKKGWYKKFIPVSE